MTFHNLLRESTRKIEKKFIAEPVLWSMGQNRITAPRVNVQTATTGITCVNVNFSGWQKRNRSLKMRSTHCRGTRCDGGKRPGNAAVFLCHLASTILNLDRTPIWLMGDQEFDFSRWLTSVSSTTFSPLVHSPYSQ